MISSSLISNSKEIIKMTGVLSKKKYSISTDSRKYEKNALFLALNGDNFDGFDYVEEVIKKGAEAIVINENRDESHLVKKYNHCCFIKVKDTITYLQDISCMHVRTWKKNNSKRKIIGITGSNGKTTTKEMLYHLLSHIMPGKIHCSEGNYNNHIGVPLTLLQLQDKHEMAIIEMGTNHPGEIAHLCRIAYPDTGIITNIGKAHLEFFKTEDNIFKEKMELFHSVKKTNPSSFFIMDQDDLFLSSIPKDNFTRHVTTILTDPHRAKIIDEDIIIENKYILGLHNFKNLAMSFVLSSLLKPEKRKELVDAMSTFTPNKNRSSWVRKGGKNFFLDAYNANPSSMETSLRSFVDYCKEKKISMNSCLFVLGDMNELGDMTESLHEKTGCLLKHLGAINVCFVGKFNHHYVKGYGNNCMEFPNKETFLPFWKKSTHTHFFLKGSRSLNLETLVE